VNNNTQLLYLIFAMKYVYLCVLFALVVCAVATDGSANHQVEVADLPHTSGSFCGAGKRWVPAPTTTWQWQLTGTLDTSFKVQMYDIDLYDSTAAQISTLHAQGKVVICYFSTQYEDWRPDAASFTPSVLGNNMDGWPGEKWVDIRSPVVRNIMSSRLDLAVQKGCDGVEPDNVDGYTNHPGFPLTYADQINFNTFLATTAHSKSLSIGLKNDLDQVKDLVNVFDWALNEQCNQYQECKDLTPFITAGKAVFNCEYSGTPANVCKSMVSSSFSTIFKSLDLNAPIKAQCCTYAANNCTAAAHKCV